MRLKIILLSVLLGILAIVVLCRACDPFTTAVVDRAKSSRYEVTLEGRFLDTTPVPYLSLKSKKRDSWLGLASTVVRVYNRGGSVRFVSDSVVLVSTYWRPVDSGRTEVLVPLYCDVKGVWVRDQGLLEDQTETALYHHSEDSADVWLFELTSKRQFRLFTTTGFLSDWGADLYIVGAKGVNVTAVDSVTSRLEILWNCTTQPEVFSVSYKGGRYSVKPG
jgi:hypothetical protein